MVELSLFKTEHEISIFIKWLVCTLILTLFLLIMMLLSNYFSRCDDLSNVSSLKQIMEMD